MEELLSIMEDDGLSTPGSSRRSSLDSCEGVRLESGIYMVRNRTCSEDSTDDLPVLVDRETQMDVETSKYDGNSDPKEEQDAGSGSSENFQSVCRAETTSLGITEDDAAEGVSGDGMEDDVDGVVDPASGPAGISWDFGQGRLTRSRQDSILGEIAQVKSRLNSYLSSVHLHCTCTSSSTSENHKADILHSSN